MKIAVLSGKGGTGKTTVAASLFSCLDRCQYIDCDVEEPNGAIFLKPDLPVSCPVNVPTPRIDPAKCNGCGSCRSVCRFNAITVIKGRALLFPELCHHCGACLIVCESEAISEKDREIGIIETNSSGTFMHGRLHIGEPVSIPVIRALKRRLQEDIPVVLDCPPGASCAVVRSIEGCDYCLLVAEPTPFGLHDLNIAVQLVRKMGIPFAVVVNKASDTDRSVQKFCRQNGIEIVLEIPFSKEIAQEYSRGILPVVANPEWKKKFMELYTHVERGIQT
ncbi:MAG: ATP-binding protein [Clostridia bacterium]|jgi:MinD superfamily P-loop ATPase|nr:ATP-binding protein [Clostridia bacterium]